MKKRRLLSTLIAIFTAAVLCFFAGCGLFGGGSSGNPPIDSYTIRYLHFIDVDGNELFDYRVDKYYSETDLINKLEAKIVDYCSPKNGKYFDGTVFSTAKNKLNDYFVNHNGDTYVSNYSAYTVVMEMVPVTHSVDYYVDGQPHKHFDLTYAEWQDFTPPPVPAKGGFYGRWSKTPSKSTFDDLRVDAVYEVAYSISSAADWSKIAEHPDACFVLENDIDFSGGEIPVLDEFGGTLDGRGYKVKNFSNPKTVCEEAYGIFCVNNGMITDVNFSGGSCTVETKFDALVVNVGLLAGVNNGTITDVQVENFTFDIICGYSNSAKSDHVLELEYGAGALVGKNSGEIEYVTVSNSVNVKTDTDIKATRMDYPSAEMTVFASCGGVAGINKGRIDHATSSVSLTGKTSLSDNIGAQGGYKYEIFNYYLKMGGIVGANNGGGTVLNSLADCAISPEHTASAGRNFTSVVDIGGIAGANSGIITNCRSTQNTSFEFNCSVETRIGGIVGANDSSVYGCYSEAAFTLSNRSETEKIYAGGVAGVNNRGIDSSYAIVSSLSRRLTMSIANVYFGGLFGYADNGIASVNNCFVKLAANGIGNSNVFGFYEGGYIDSWCYVFLTENATGYGDCDKVTKCATEQDLLAAISNRDFEGKGFTLSPDSYPALPHAGNIKQ